MIRFAAKLNRIPRGSNNVHEKIPRLTLLRNYNKSAIPTTSRTYDMVISGGGIVGAALACRIAGSNNAIMKKRRVACLEAFKPKSFEQVTNTSNVDLRTYAIAPKSARLLEDIGVWDRVVETDRCQPFSSMQVWDATGSENGFVNFNNAHENLGYIVENNVLQAALYEKMVELENENRLDLLCPSTVENIEEVNIGGYAVKTSTEEEDLYTNLLVAADGGNSKVRNLLGFGNWGWKYEQDAIVATVKLDMEQLSMDDAAGESIDFLTGRLCKTWQRFLPTGPVAILPLWDGMASIVWSNTIENTKKLKECTKEEFILKLNEAFQENFIGSQLPSFLPPNPLSILQSSESNFSKAPIITELCSPIVSFPLQFSQATTYAKSGVALIGDAAHTVHPMGGQGLNLGLGDVDALGTLLEEVNDVGGNFGDINVLNKYEKERKEANVIMGASLDLLKRVFDSQSGPLQVARTLGMATLNSTPIIKERIAKYAMGL
jgi:ubiquinone biosynthesis UbiH/UbiF/VisC/COQ6 family hydroxylase